MGGKGSGRHRKPLRIVIEKFREDIKTLDQDIYALYQRVHGLDMRLEYWLKKVEKDEIRNS